jgi:predicted enzyme related to lactoylglutathione lyase
MFCPQSDDTTLSSALRYDAPSQQSIVTSHPNSRKRKIAMSSVINWFDIPATDFDRAVTFYETVLGVRLIQDNMLGARLAIFPAKPGETTGAIMARSGVTPATGGTTIYLKAGSDLSLALKRVEVAGGKLLHPKTFIKEGFGYFAILLDTEGNSVGLHSPN